MNVREYSFRGIRFKAATYDRTPQDASWYTHDDEVNVRDRDWLVGPGDVIFDVGSAYGSYTLTALAVGASFVHCWNYNADENRILRESLALNGWESQCQIHEVGLWSRRGYLEDVGVSFSEEPVPGKFPVTTLDLEVPHTSRVSWLKLDVEGAEVEVLRGAENLLRAARPRIQVENHQFKDSTLEKRVRELLEGYGFRHVQTIPYHAVSHSLYEPG